MVYLGKLFVMVFVGITLFETASCSTIPIGKLNATTWVKMADCFRQKLGPESIGDDDIRCVAREMIASFEEMDQVACKNCQLYFDCQANRNIFDKCSGRDRAREGAIAVGECLKEKGRIMDFSASEFGRAGNDCKTRYLCSSNCNYSPDLKSCSKTNCRPAIKGERRP